MKRKKTNHQTGSSPPPPSKRIKIEHGNPRQRAYIQTSSEAELENEECSQCRFSWKKKDLSMSYFRLPCQSEHILCPSCFSTLMSSKGSMHFFHCPSCKENESKAQSSQNRYTRWEIVSPQQTRQGGIRRKEQIHSLVPPDPVLQPVLHHHSIDIMNPQSTEARHATLTLSTIRKTKQKQQTTKESLHSVSVLFNADNVESIDETTKDNIAKIFQYLHPLLIPPSKEEYKEKYDFLPPQSNSGNQLFQAASLDNTCLFKCIYSLSTGNPPPSQAVVQAIESTHRKTFHVQIFAIVEMIRNKCILKARSVLKDFVGQQLMMNCAPQALYRILNQVGIANSNETVRLDNIKDCEKKILSGYNLDGKKYDLFLILFDNLGFRVRGGKTNRIGYEQYTALEIVNVTKASLIEWGVYPNKETNQPGKFRYQFINSFLFLIIFVLDYLPYFELAVSFCLLRCINATQRLE